MNVHQEFDLIVVGGGAAGLAAAHRAAELKNRVLVLEKTDAVGGSAALSAGILWTAPDHETLHEIQPDGAWEFTESVVDDYDTVLEHVHRAGVEVSEQWFDHLEWGRACKIDVHGLFATWTAEIEQAGGQIVTSVSNVELITNDKGAVVGATYNQAGQQQQAYAQATVLTTGGFQGDPELRQQFIGFGADSIAVRSNDGSVGDGFRLGTGAGGSASTQLSAFYGHTLPSPLPVNKEVFLRLTLYFSAYGIIVNREGKRFTNEHLGDEVSNQRVLRQTGRRAVLLWDEETHQDKALAVPYPSGMALDRHAEAEKLGARTAHTDTVEELMDEVAKWGVDRAALQTTLNDYERAADGEQAALDAPLPEKPRPLRTGPFRAVEIQPCMTIPFGGLRVDLEGHVLNRDGQAVEGLYAAGADAGGMQDLRYVGGIVFGFSFGRRIAESIFAAVPAGTA